MLAFLSRVKGNPMIWVRPLESSHPRPLPRTEGANRPFWSPDSRSLAFFSQGELKKIDVAGGPPIVVCKEAGRDIAWSADNVMLIGGQNKPLLRVPASGGEPTAATELAAGETTHDYPQFLPDNRHFLYMARRGPNAEDWDVYVGRLDSKERRLLEGIHAAVRYSPTGHLLFIREQTLMAQPFDPDRLALEGHPIPVVEGVPAGPRPLFSVSRNGTLVYLTPDELSESQLAWVDRTGTQSTPFTPRGIYNRLVLSLDGRYVAFDRQLDILLFDIERNAASSFITRPGADVAPVFSADGSRIAFASSRGSASNVSANNPIAGNLFQRAVAAVEVETALLTDNRGKTPTDWSQSGHLLFTSLNDLWALPPGSAQPVRVTDTPFIETGARFSPDGQWIAYQSNDSATGQDVYIQSFPVGDRRYPASVGGGTVPRWARSGKELYYIAPDLTMMAVPVSQSGTTLALGKPVRLFQSRALQGDREYRRRR